MTSGLYSSPTDIAAVTKALSVDINNIDAAVAVAFDKLPTEVEIKRGTINYAVDTGAVNAYVVALPYVPSGYVDGLAVVFRPLNTNTGVSTINVNSLGVKSIRRSDGSAVSAGDIVVGVPLTARYSTATGFFHIPSNSSADAANAAAAAAAAAVSASGASTSEANATASAALASSIAAGLNATSTSSLAIGTGSKSFTTQSGKQFAAGQFISAASAANSANYMHGQVTSYSSTNLVVNVTDIGGSGTLADWNISVSGSQGSIGPTGATGTGILTKVEVSGTTQTATSGNDYFLGNVSLTAVTAPASADGAHFAVTPGNGLLTNTIDFGAATVRGPAGTASGVITINLGARMEFIYSSTLSKWVLL